MHHSAYASFASQYELEQKKKAEAAVAAEVDRAAAVYDPLTRRTLEELDEAGEGEEYADSRELEAYRAARIAQIKETAARNKFGSLLPLSRDDFVREVTEGSKSVWVVLLLYKDTVPDSKLALPIFHRVRSGCEWTARSYSEHESLLAPFALARRSPRSTARPSSWPSCRTRASRATLTSECLAVVSDAYATQTNEMHRGMMPFACKRHHSIYPPLVPCAGTCRPCSSTTTGPWSSSSWGSPRLAARAFPMTVRKQHCGVMPGLMPARRNSSAPYPCCTAVEWVLAQHGAVKTELEDDPRESHARAGGGGGGRGRTYGDDDEDD